MVATMATNPHPGNAACALSTSRSAKCWAECMVFVPLSLPLIFQRLLQSTRLTRGSVPKPFLRSRAVHPFSCDVLRLG